MYISKRQRETLDYIDLLNSQHRKSALSSQYTTGPQCAKTLRMLDMRPVRALKRKGLISLVYPNTNEHLDSEFWPVLTEAGEEMMFKLFTSKW